MANRRSTKVCHNKQTFRDRTEETSPASLLETFYDSKYFPSRDSMQEREAELDADGD
jgi:hypothetical protein